jgi:ketosteroid isomerase-like protein
LVSLAVFQFYVSFSNQNNMKIIMIVFILFTVITGCGEKKVDTEAEGEKLMQISRDWSKSAATDSIEKTLGYWADDAVVMSPGDAPIKGKNAIRGMMEAGSKIPGFKISWEPLSVVVSQSGDMAYMIEQNQVSVNDSLGKPITTYNKAVTVWRKEADGSWKNIVDMWNAVPAEKK